MKIILGLFGSKINTFNFYIMLIMGIGRRWLGNKLCRYLMFLILFLKSSVIFWKNIWSFSSCFFQKLWWETSDTFELKKMLHICIHIRMRYDTSDKYQMYRMKLEKNIRSFGLSLNFNLWEFASSLLYWSFILGNIFVCLTQTACFM